MMSLACPCGAPIKGKGKTGLCMSCAVKRAFVVRPDLLKVRSRNASLAASRPEERARRSALAKSMGLDALGRAARTPASFAKLSRSLADAKLAHIPADRRADYRFLTTTKRLLAAEAAAVILADEERRLKLLRDRMAA